MAPAAGAGARGRRRVDFHLELEDGRETRRDDETVKRGRTARAQRQHARRRPGPAVLFECESVARRASRAERRRRARQPTTLAAGRAR